MKNETFIKANKVFNGTLRKNKSEGHDTSKPIKFIQQKDVEKLYDKYLIPGLAKADTEILQHKVFFDLLYYTGHHGKEGLRKLKKDSFEIKT